jgi:hypothetical protein
MQDANDEVTHELDPGDREFVAALAGLRPRGVEAGARDAMMFEAGARSVRASLRAWRLATAACFALAVSMVPLLMRTAMTTVSPPQHVVQAPSSPLVVIEVPAANGSPFSLASLRAAALEAGDVGGAPVERPGGTDVRHEPTPTLRIRPSTLNFGDPS